LKVIRLEMNRECVLITGSSRGLGKQLALVFARNNHDIILHGRDKKRLAEVREEVVKSGVDCFTCAGDLKQGKTIDALCKLAREKDVTVLINNAGTSLRSKDAEELDLKLPLEETSTEQIDDILMTNLLAPIKLTKGIYPLLLEKKRGTIININSRLGREPRELNGIYCASKWGLRGFTDSLRREAGKRGIRVMGIYPGRIKTRACFTRGMEPGEAAQKIYDAYRGNADEVILDERHGK
jgi:short-subunit dehydrogenase